MNSATIVTDLHFGDCGKGSLTNHLVNKRDASLVVRSNGGAQAAHHVTRKDGLTNCFNQIGSGSFNPKAATFWSKYCLFDPQSFRLEQMRFDALSGVAPITPRYYVDEKAIVVTPYHRVISRLRELSRGAGKHGTCGHGVGETMRIVVNNPDLVLRVEDFRRDNGITIGIMEDLRKFMFEQFKQFRDSLVIDDFVKTELRIFEHVDKTRYATYPVVENLKSIIQSLNVLDAEGVHKLIKEHQTVIFEGAQGVLLDQDYGTYPYNTWSTTTSENAHRIIADVDSDVRAEEIGVIRTFLTRHGPGPMPSENASLLKTFTDYNNGTNPWQGAFRFGQLDFVLLDYALSLNKGVDSFAITHADWLNLGIPWLPAEMHVIGRETYSKLPVPKAPNFLRQQQFTDILMKAKAINTGLNSYNLTKTTGIESVMEMMKTRFGIPTSVYSEGPNESQYKSLL